MSEQHSEYGIYVLTPLSRAVALVLAEACQRVSLCDDDATALRDFVLANRATRGGLVGFADLRDFVASLNEPRIIVAGSEQSRARVEALLSSGDRCIAPVLADPAVLTHAAKALADELLTMAKGSSA